MDEFFSPAHVDADAVLFGGQ